jgi:hypothetical protein
MNGKPGLRVTFDPSDPDDIDFILDVMVPGGLVPSSVANDLRGLSADLRQGSLKSLLKFSAPGVSAEMRHTDAHGVRAAGDRRRSACRHGS